MSFGDRSISGFRQSRLHVHDCKILKTDLHFLVGIFHLLLRHHFDQGEFRG